MIAGPFLPSQKSHACRTIDTMNFYLVSPSLYLKKTLGHPTMPPLEGCGQNEGLKREQERCRDDRGVPNPLPSACVPGTRRSKQSQSCHLQRLLPDPRLDSPSLLMPVDIQIHHQMAASSNIPSPWARLCSDSWPVPCPSCLLSSLFPLLPKQILGLLQGSPWSIKAYRPSDGSG